MQRRDMGSAKSAAWLIWDCFCMQLNVLKIIVQFGTVLFGSE